MGKRGLILGARPGRGRVVGLLGTIVGPPLSAALHAHDPVFRCITHSPKVQVSRGLGEGGRPDVSVGGPAA